MKLSHTYSALAYAQPPTRVRTDVTDVTYLLTYLLHGAESFFRS